MFMMIKEIFESEKRWTLFMLPTNLHPEMYVEPYHVKMGFSLKKNYIQ